MLPNDANTLVPLDISIQSYEPDQMGFMSWQYAWEKLSRDSWLRIAKIYGKIFAVTAAVEITCLAIIGLQVLIVTSVGEALK